MKKVCLLLCNSFFLFCFSVFFGCGSKYDNTAILQQIDEGLVQSNRQIRLQTDAILHEFEKKLSEPRTAYKTATIRPKAIAIHHQTDLLIAYIYSLKAIFRNNAGVKQNSKQRQTSHNNEAVRNFFVDQDGTAQLLAKLQQYKMIVMETDERIEQQIPALIVLLSREADSAKNSEALLKKTLGQSSAIEALTYLSRIENNIVIDENKLLEFLNAQTSSYDDGYFSFNAIVGQNSQILEGGQTLEITAGAGKFTVRNLISVLINNQKQLISERGVAIYKMKTQKKPGKYQIPVQVTYIDQDGQSQTMTISVKYKTVSANLK